MQKKKTPYIEEDPFTVGGYLENISIDRMGSYTGRTEYPWDKPVQDADDL